MESKMELKLDSRPLAALETDTLAVLAFTEEKADAALDAATGGWISETLASGEFTGKSLETALLHRPSGLKAKRLLLVGAGARAKLSGIEVRNAAGAALRVMKPKGCRDLTIALGELTSAEFVEAAVEGAILADFEPDQLKTDPKKSEKRVETLQIAAPKALENALFRGKMLAESQNFTRSLVNQPANLLTPLKLAEAAQAMAAECGLECEILDRARMQQLGMGALLGVAQGSLQPPALIVIRYKPAGTANSSAHLALVGKGVTFDTGGVSIKPSEGMEKMKYDMAGAAAVIGAMRAIAALKPSIPVTAFAPAVFACK